MCVCVGGGGQRRGRENNEAHRKLAERTHVQVTHADSNDKTV